MSAIKDLLQEADPLRVESEPSAADRSFQRQVILTAAATRPLPPAKSWLRTSVYLSIMLITIVAFVAISRLWSPFINNVQAAVQFEVRLVERDPAAGLKAANLEGGGTVYLHDEVVVTNSDIAQAKAIPRPGGSDFMVSITFTPAGARKMHETTERNIGKRMAILIDGVIVTAPVVNSVFSESAVVEGHLTKQEAERIVAGITIPAR
jgi:preprotein translocase subunit SecD